MSINNVNNDNEIQVFTTKEEYNTLTTTIKQIPSKWLIYRNEKYGIEIDISKHWEWGSITESASKPHIIILTKSYIEPQNNTMISFNLEIYALTHNEYHSLTGNEIFNELIVWHNNEYYFTVSPYLSQWLLNKIFPNIECIPQNTNMTEIKKCVDNTIKYKFFEI